MSSSSSNSSRSDSDSSSDGEIRDEEKAVKKKAKNIKTETEEGEMDEAVKRFCEAKLKEVKSVLGVELETLITMRAHAEEARETAKKAEGDVAKTLKKISELQREKARLQVPNIAFHLQQSVLFLQLEIGFQKSYFRNQISDITARDVPS